MDSRDPRPLHVAASIAAVYNKCAARTLLPASSALAIVDGTIGFGYHVRGVLRGRAEKEVALQHSLWTAHLRAAALRRVRSFGIACQRSAEGKR